MTNTVVRRTATAAIAGLFLAVGAAVAVAPAHADPIYDQQFIEYLEKKGVPYKSRTDIIRTAKQFCLDTTRQGNPDWLAGYNLASKEGWTQTETENFVMAAIPTYCPQLWE
jgi:Protein of unknown function (DUF732)